MHLFGSVRGHCFRYGIVNPQAHMGQAQGLVDENEESGWYWFIILLSMGQAYLARKSLL